MASVIKFRCVPGTTDFRVIFKNPSVFYYYYFFFLLHLYYYLFFAPPKSSRTTVRVSYFIFAEENFPGNNPSPDPRVIIGPQSPRSVRILYLRVHPSRRMRIMLSDLSLDTAAAAAAAGRLQKTSAPTVCWPDFGADVRISDSHLLRKIIIII